MQYNDIITKSYAQLNEKYARKHGQILHALLSDKQCEKKCNRSKLRLRLCTLALTVITLATAFYWCENDAYKYLLGWCLGIRCVIPNNYFVWEATRPISNCHFCINVTQPIILQNATQDEFATYAYTSKPVVVKQAFLHWPAYQKLDFHFFKQLYERYDDGIKSVDEECQFLHFKSDFISLQDVFEMSEERVQNNQGEKSWYVGWGNCHPHILRELRQYYSKPHFLPEDCEMPAKDYVFMGYDDGATMHLDFINRLMWQAQLKGSKTWRLLPSTECEELCTSVTFQVEPGDAELKGHRLFGFDAVWAPRRFGSKL